MSLQLAKTPANGRTPAPQRKSHGGIESTNNSCQGGLTNGEVPAAFLDPMQAHEPERSWRRDLSKSCESFGERRDKFTLETMRAEAPRVPAALRSPAEA